MPTIQDVSLKCRNFKCFGDAPQGFDKIRPINIIVGRNNTGKSTLLELVKFATQPEPLAARGHKGKVPTVTLYMSFDEQTISQHIPDTNASLQSQGLNWGFPARRWALGNLKDKTLTLQLTENGQVEFKQLDHGLDISHHQTAKQVEWIGSRLNTRVASPFREFTFQRILSDRDVVPESANYPKMEITSNGSGLTHVIEQYINRDWLPSELVETTLRDELNKIFFPDAFFDRILVQQNGQGFWEIHVEEEKKGRVALSQMGSGFKTVLLVLGNLLFVPKLIDSKPPLSQFIFAFEELENNLHPAIQRRLFLYLRTKAVEEKCYFFVTTHSNVVIDLFSGDDSAQIIHVTHNGESASASLVETYSHGHTVLDDLDVRASDLLQTNAVVWVEGPSDRHYFSKWIELWTSGKLVENVHFQCLPYGGSCNAHYSFDSPEVVDELIPALRINRHAVLLADSDRTKDGDDLKVHLQRLSKEITDGGGYSWVTAGKEVENYIPPCVFQKMFNNDSLKGPDQYSDVLEYVRQKKGNKTPPQKTTLSHEVVQHLTKETLADTLDMKEKLNDICTKIAEWNRVTLAP